jgi:hypothetical protein
MDERFALEGYVVDELIGFGGTGEVWRAHENATGESVALKRLRARGAAASERLRREAGVLATVAGPHVIGVRRMVVDDDEAVMVMDYAAGGNLATVLEVRGRLPAPEVVTVLAPIAAALAAAHARDLIHADITPANILFTAEGRPLLADFGVARVLGSGPHQVEGTVDFLDPAVAAGSTPDAASDVFALGAVGFTALAGHSPWAYGERPPVADVAPTAPAAFVAVIESMLAVDPDERPDARSAANAILQSCAAAPVGMVVAAVASPSPPTVTLTRNPPMRPTARPAAARPTTLPAAPPSSRREHPGTRDADPADPSWSRWRRQVVIAGAAGLALVGAIGIGVSLAHLGRGQAHVLAPGPTSPGTATAPAEAKSPTGVSRWTAVISHLDELRAQAFSEANAGLLAAVYAPGTSAYAADLNTVNSLVSRGLRAQGFTATVDDVSVESATATTEQLRVVDELTGYTLVDASGRVEGRGAPRPARAFTMELADVAGSWRVEAISPDGAAASRRAGRPAPRARGLPAARRQCRCM